MKKFLLFAGLCMFGFQLQAQDARNITKQKQQPKNHKQNATVQLLQPLSTSTTPFWTDDFSSATNWVISNAAGNTDNWVIGTTGPSGTYAIPVIASPTAANGFALFDSDNLCSGNQNAFLTTANPINCSAHSSVILTFHQQFRRYVDSTYVLISTNGTTWTNVPFGNNLLALNAFPGNNPNVVSLNISSIAAGQDSVWVRFHFYSVPPMTPTPGCGYAWMIDDVSMSAAALNDLSLSSLSALSTDRFDVYGTYNETNREGDSLLVRATISNLGALAQPNTRFELIVLDSAGNTVATRVQNLGNFAASRVDSAISPALPLNAIGVGKYRLVARVLSDSTDATPNNNADTSYFDVSPRAISMAIRNPLRTGALGTNSFPSFPGAEDDFRCASVLEQFVTDTVSGMYMKFGPNTAPGGLITAEIRDANNLSNIIMQSDLHVVTAADIARGDLWLPMEGNVNARILADGDYYMSVSLFSNVNAAHVTILDDETNEAFKRTGSSIIYTADDQTWYNNGIAFAIDVTYGASNVSVKDMDNQYFRFVGLYPNPARDEATIGFELKRNEEVRITIRDMKGRVVGMENLGQLNTGEYQHRLSLNQLNAGLYFVELATSSFNAAQKLMLQK
ncbi:MAG: T9SS type A sorting domain-containing protein [Bacteroidia bacterium]